MLVLVMLLLAEFFILFRVVFAMDQGQMLQDKYLYLQPGQFVVYPDCQHIPSYFDTLYVMLVQER